MAIACGLWEEINTPWEQISTAWEEIGECVASNDIARLAGVNYAVLAGERKRRWEEERQRQAWVMRRKKNNEAFMMFVGLLYDD